MTAISVIVPARDAAATLPRTLAALQQQDFDLPYEILVVDDGSTDGTADAAGAAGGNVSLIPGPGRGAAEARNRGAAEASADLLAFTDADCFPTPDWLAAGARALRDADLVQGAVRPEPGERLGPFDRSLWVVEPSGLHESANLFVRRELLERVGGFEPALKRANGRPMGEDVWFGWRARRAGARYLFCVEALVHHAVFARGPREYAAERWRTANFPELVAQIPELRRSFLFARLFLNARTASFDAALAGAGVAGAVRSRVPLALAVPYLWKVWTGARRGGGRRLPVATADAVADVITFLALARGSIRARCPVL